MNACLVSEIFLSSLQSEFFSTPVSRPTPPMRESGFVTWGCVDQCWFTYWPLPRTRLLDDFLQLRHDFWVGLEQVPDTLFDLFP